MFSRAKRFDYYPKPEEPSASCNRCLDKHKKSCTKKPRSIMKRTQPLHQKMETVPPTEEIKNPFEDDLRGSIDFSLNCSSISLFDEFQFTPVASPAQTFTREEVVQVHHSVDDIVYHSISETDTPTTSLSSAQVHCPVDETFYDSILEVSPTPDGDDLTQFLDERKIDNQRQKISTWRRHLVSTSSSGDEGFHSSRSTSPSETDIQDRIKHVEDLSRVCVKETLDFITMYNKIQEAKCSSMPHEYKDLVEFCSELILELSNKFGEKKSKKKWRKVKKFFGGVFGKMGRLFRHQ